MSAPYSAPALCNALRASLLLAALAPTALASAAWGQTSTTPQQGTLQPPSAHKSTTPAVPPTPPRAAPRPAVHQLGKPAPVVRPHGPTHAEPAKKKTTAAAKPAAKPHGPVPPAAAGAAVGAAVGAAAATASAPVPPVQPPPAPAEPPKGTASGLPLPRFVALRSDEVNLRAGPGTRYPIEWVYKRRDLPVEIEREFEVWRLVKDQDGVKGWVHQATLTSRRSFVVTGTERTLRQEAKPDASPVARLQPGVVGRIRSCDAGSDWCQVQVGDYRGWLKRDEFWGVLPGEAVNN
jgi:SH3-like domain-containing protein